MLEPKVTLSKGQILNRSRAAIRTVAAGQSLLPAEIVKLAESPAHSELLERELQVLQIYCEWQKQHGDRTNSRYQRRYSKGSHKVYTHKVGRNGPYRSHCHRCQARAYPSGLSSGLSLISSSVILKCFTLSGGEGVIDSGSGKTTRSGREKTTQPAYGEWECQVLRVRRR
jgi:hypothetical protein